jgi:hypothetical protein
MPEGAVMLGETKLKGPVKVESNTDERVAYELMRWISEFEPDRQDAILELYARCLLTIQAPNLGVAKIRSRAKGQ